MKKMAMLLAVLLGIGFYVSAEEGNAPTRERRSRRERPDRGERPNRGDVDLAKLFKLNAEEKAAHDQLSSTFQADRTTYTEAKAKLDAELKVKIQKNFDATSELLSKALERREKAGEDVSKLKEQLSKRTENRDRLIQMQLLQAGFPGGLRPDMQQRPPAAPKAE